MQTAYIGIGSNLGDRLENCEAGVRLLSLYEGIRVDRVSPWYETEHLPLKGDKTPQPRYVNGAARLATGLGAHQLLSVLQEVEARMGRPPAREKGLPRSLDLDLLLYGDELLEDQRLVLPHPGLSKRLFVLIPLCDIAPDVVDPRSGLSAAEMRELLLTNTEANI